MRQGTWWRYVCESMAEITFEMKGKLHTDYICEKQTKSHNFAKMLKTQNHEESRQDIWWQYLAEILQEKKEGFPQKQLLRPPAVIP